MEVGLVQKINIDQEMQQAYLDYAMSVIVARALPDARDGLKPVHRRILYAMFDMGLRPDSGYKKSARIVGEVLGKYHPHGDAAVYDAMARMVQPFSMRYPLVDGQGNFGSIDGDSPAAMRYTEARMASPTIEMLSDIQKDTVDYIQNFDETLTEPEVLPAALPNMLINGGSGIAVGMATNIPPHNLGEVSDALIHILERWTKVDDISVEELMEFVKGPDFPTGGVIIRDPEEDRLTNAYSTGRGRVIVQAQAHVEEMGRGRQRVIVTELPFMTNKATLIGRIAKLAREGDIEGISDLRDESDRQGMRIVIELTKNADPEEVLRALYRRTPLQSTFSIIMLALVNGEPRLLSLKQALRVYLEHRLEVIRRRSEFDLAQARSRAHILEGLRTALQNLEEVIELIRKSADVDKARTRLQRSFKLSEEQAQAILDMPLRRLAAMERRKIETEYKEKLKTIKALEVLLGSPKKMRSAVAEELQTLKETYSDRRRTRIVQLKKGAKPVAMLTTEDTAPSRTVWVAVTKSGLISRTAENKLPRLSGRNAPSTLVRVNTRDTLYLVAINGKTAAIPVHTVPETDSTQKGVPVDQICPLLKSDGIVAAFSLPPKTDAAVEGYVLMTTRSGMVKKTHINEFPGPTARAFKSVNLKSGDELGWVQLTDGKSQIMLVSAGGMAIRFAESDVRYTGLATSGVMGIKLKAGDELIGTEIVTEPGEVLIVSSSGAAKRVAFNRFPKQGRYGQGVLAWKLPETERLVGVATGRGTQRATIHLARAASKAIRLDTAPLRTRPAQGKVIIEIKPNDRITSVCAPLDPPNFEASKPVKSTRKKTPPKPRSAKKPTKRSTGTTTKKPARGSGSTGKTSTRSTASTTKKTTRSTRSTGRKTTRKTGSTSKK